MKKKSSLNQKKKIATTSLAGLFAASAGEAVVVTNNAGFTVSDDITNFHDWNIDGEGSAELRVDASYSTFSSGSFTYRYINLLNFANGFRAATSGGALVNLAPGAQVAEWGSFVGGQITSVFYSGGMQSATGFISGESGYMGFQFQPDSTVLYGWAEVVLTNGAFGTFEVVRWAYEDSGANIHPGGCDS